jgi:hypothetical protein
MKHIKNELQHIIFGNEPFGKSDKLKKTQNFLRKYAEASVSIKNRQPLKSEEVASLLDFAEKEHLFYTTCIAESDFICEGAEQRVYRLNDFFVLKKNG